MTDSEQRGTVVTESGSAVQPIVASAVRALDRLVALGEPIAPSTVAAVAELSDLSAADVREELDRLLAPHTLLELAVGARGPEHARQVGESAQLMQGGWRSFLIRAINPGGLTTDFAVS